MIFLIILKALFLLIGIVYTFSNVGKMLFFRHNNITGFQIWMMAIGIVGFITMQFWFKV